MIPDPTAMRRARERLIAEQIRPRGIDDPLVLAAIARVPRHLFVPEDEVALAYDDSALPIGDGQTISQPYMVALMTSLLALRGGERVLEVGTGSGYHAAVLAEIAGVVHTTERQPHLAARARMRLRRLSYANVHVHLTRGAVLGWPRGAPYDAIVVAAAARHRVPAALVAQLRPGGVLVIPLGERHAQTLTVVRTNPHTGATKQRAVCGCVFVPLITSEP